jgi:putative ABC transport system substrate-binding protein
VRRREFITLVGGVATWPFAARAQQQPKRPIIGFLIPSNQTAYRQRVDAGVARLKELGWVEGQNVAFAFRWAEFQRFDDILAEFVQLKVDIIWTGGTPPVVAAKRLTSEIPIVFAPAGDPVGAGLVQSLARPGGNVTGLSNQTAEIAGKRIGLLREIAPTIRRLAVMSKRGNRSASLEMAEVRAAATTVGIEFVPVEIGQAEDIAPVFEGLKDRADALYVVVDSLVTTQEVQINTLALAAKLPTIHGARELVAAGGLMSYGANYLDIWRRSADFVDRILRGTKPADIPVEQPTKFDLVINLTTAKVLGISVPLSLLGRADEVIE